jgi:hypothetical protein
MCVVRRAEVLYKYYEASHIWFFSLSVLFSILGSDILISVLFSDILNLWKVKYVFVSSSAASESYSGGFRPHLHVGSIELVWVSFYDRPSVGQPVLA